MVLCMLDCLSNLFLIWCLLNACLFQYFVLKWRHITFCMLILLFNLDKNILCNWLKIYTYCGCLYFLSTLPWDLLFYHQGSSMAQGLTPWELPADWSLTMEWRFPSSFLCIQCRTLNFVTITACSITAAEKILRSIERKSTGNLLNLVEVQLVLE